MPQTQAACRRTREGSAHLVEGAVLVILGETVLLQEVILQEASSLQCDLVPLSQRVLPHHVFKQSVVIIQGSIQCIIQAMSAT